jgi:hypothetical protein
MKVQLSLFPNKFRKDVVGISLTAFTVNKLKLPEQWISEVIRNKRMTKIHIHNLILFTTDVKYDIYKI